MLVRIGLAFGFGRVGGEHGHDVELIEDLLHIGCAQPFFV
jgi:hypothetical protein